MTERQGQPPRVFDLAFLTDAREVTEVLLIRHAQQEVNRKGPVGDMIDPPLSEHGRQQARLLGEALSTLNIDAVFSSPLRRAMETAAAVARHQRLEVVTIEDLKEVQIFRDLPPDQPARDVLGREFLVAVEYRMQHERSWDVYPYSESSYEFRKRAINAVETAIAMNAGQRIAVVCHGGVINAYIGHIIKSPFDMFFRPAHTSVNIVVAGNGRRVLRSLNDIHHLRTPEGEFHTY